MIRIIILIHSLNCIQGNQNMTSFTCVSPCHGNISCMYTASFTKSWLTWITFSFSPTGLAGAEIVSQPSTHWAEMGQSATINCSHTKGVDYNQMYWYRQYHGESMELIVFTSSYGTLDFGKFDEKKFSAFKPDPGSGSFTVKSVNHNDTAVYFCAVSKHSVLTTGQSCTKTHSLCDWLIEII